MMHYKLVAMDDFSSIYSWKEKWELKHEDNIECLKKIASIQSTIVKKIEESSNTIKGKDCVIVGLRGEVYEITMLENWLSLMSTLEEVQKPPRSDGFI
jgi:tRNA(Ile2) C34 agmatinyltransferase TiaS